MDFVPYDSSGTDDDISLPHQNRMQRGGRVAGNGRPAVPGSVSYGIVYNDTEMENQIHLLEQEAYSSVLRAFKAQADAITWEKASLMTELRKELRLSNEEHRELLSQVNSDELIRRISEWRQSGGNLPIVAGTGQIVRDPVPSPSVSASRKKQKIASAVPSQSYGGPSTSTIPQSIGASGQPSSSSAAKRGTMLGSKSKRPKSSGQMLPGRAQHASSSGVPGRAPQLNNNNNNNRVTTGASASEATTFDPLIGRKVRTRWPDDNNFYEAVITNYNADEGRHALVYDIGTENETWELVNLSEISPEDIMWNGDDPGVSRQGDFRHRTDRPVVGRESALPSGRGVPKSRPRKDLPPSQQNGAVKKGTDEIKILNTDSLIKEVERVFSISHPDPIEVEKAKKALKEQEQALTAAIAKLADISEGENGMKLL
ncbi:protein EMSY-LIKE 3-like [Impatiens glandulifera]|uniref:protein EMSY-LIKE 3-like n=1 Tax=Impatiens glandulifera TaxID=253017 RepID=UPI001FB14277|nr:protein EMSY-LIKE 3-like [Impatiens glandulifera]